MSAHKTTKQSNLITIGYLSLIFLSLIFLARMHSQAAQELRSEIEEMQQEETTGLMDEPL